MVIGRIPNDKQNLNKNEKHIEDLDLPEEQEEKISNLPAFGCSSESISSSKYSSRTGPRYFDIKGLDDGVEDSAWTVEKREEAQKKQQEHFPDPKCQPKGIYWL